MRLFEAQVKKIFNQAGICVPQGKCVSSVREAVEASEQIGVPVVLKAQVLTGGRGKVGGIKIVSGLEEVEGAAEALFGVQIKGEKVEKLLVEEKIEIIKELYLSVTMDRAAKRPVVIVSAEGGIDIEEIAQNMPGAILKHWVDPLVGFYPHHALALFKKAGFKGSILRELTRAAVDQYNIFSDYESELVEINPLVITAGERVLAADGKMILDSNGKGPKLLGLEATGEMRYVPLDGDIGIMVNGAGLTMMTMDVVSYFGGRPANFLEIGGELYKKSEQALQYLLLRKDLNAILVNLFGAYARTDIIVEGIIRGLQKQDVKIPLVFRVRGTGEQRARELLIENFGIVPHYHLTDAVKEVIEKAQDYREKRFGYAAG